MIGKLRFLEEKWVVDYEIGDGLVKEIAVHPEMVKEVAAVFDKAKDYHVEFSLCFIVEIKLYCARISKASFPNADSCILQEGVSRVEVIDEQGRSYSKWHIEKVEICYQDDGKTLKIFINK